MKICIPTSGDQGLKESVHEHFGSAPFFTIYDTDNKSIEVVANNNQHHAHGTCSPTKAIEGHNVDIVVSGGMGSRAVSLLNQQDIKAYKIDGTTVEDAVNKFNQGGLVEIKPGNACTSHDCH